MSLVNRNVRAVFFRREDHPRRYLEMCMLRTRLFAEELGWQLKITNGLEQDEFDHDWAVYCAIYEGSRLRGCFRAIPCNRPYLMRSVFSKLAPFYLFPDKENFWEISRFGVERTAMHLGRYLYCAMFEFALQRDAAALPALVDITHERLLQRMGILTRRYGAPSPVGKDAFGRQIMAVVGEIPLDPQREHIQSFFADIRDQMEFEDETSYVGSHRIPA